MRALTQLPEECTIVIAEFLDHRSLVNVGATCSLLHQQILFSDADSVWNKVWKAFHDSRWSYAKHLRFRGLPSQWHRNGNRVADDNMNWREEFIRRFSLDSGVPRILARLGINEPVSTSLSLSLERDGVDIWDKLRLLSSDPQHSVKAKRAMRLINTAEARTDWKEMTTIQARNATFEDALMILSKYLQKETLFERNTPDEIYHEIKHELDTLTLEDVERIDGMGNENQWFFVLDAVLKRRLWQHALVTYFEWRVSESHLLGDATVEWQNIMQEGCHGKPCPFSMFRATSRMMDWIDNQSGN